MERKMVIKEEQLGVPPGFSPKSETRYGHDAVTSSPSAAAFPDGNQSDGPAPILPDSAPEQNPIEDLVLQQVSSSPNSVENNVKRKRGPGDLPATKPSHFQDAAAVPALGRHSNKGQIHCLMNSNNFDSYNTTLFNEDSPSFGEGHGINSTKEDENVVEVNVPRKSQRTRNFTRDEDVCIVSAWLNTSKNVIHGCDETSSRFWKRVYDKFVAKCGQGGRTEKSIKNHWRDINTQCAKFIGCLNQVNDRHQSGQSKSKVKEARELYFASNEQKPFKYEHCFDLLKNERKWLDILERNKQTNASIVTIDGVTITSEDNSEPYANKDRLLGRKVLKEQIKRKHERAKGETSSKMPHVNKRWEEKVAIERERLAQRERIIEIQEHALRVDEERKEMEIMAKDTIGMDEAHTAYWNMKKAEVLRKNGLI